MLACFGDSPNERRRLLAILGYLSQHTNEKSRGL